MSPTDSNFLSDQTQSCPTERQFVKNARIVPASEPKSTTRSIGTGTGATVPSSITPGEVSLRYNPARVRSGCSDGNTQS